VLYFIYLNSHNASFIKCDHVCWHTVENLWDVQITVKEYFLLEAEEVSILSSPVHIILLNKQWNSATYVTEVLYKQMSVGYLTFRGPCIMIYSYNKSQWDALFHKFVLVKNSTYFGQIYCPSSGVSTLYTQQ